MRLVTWGGICLDRHRARRRSQRRSTSWVPPAVDDISPACKLLASNDADGFVQLVSYRATARREQSRRRMGMTPRQRSPEVVGRTIPGPPGVSDLTSAESVP